MIITGIDPGSFKSAYVKFDADAMAIVDADFVDNDHIYELIEDTAAGSVIGIETPTPMGAPWGHDLNETLWHAGRMYDRAFIYGHYPFRPTRMDIKKHLLGGVVGDDTSVRAAVVNVFCKYHKMDEADIKGKKASPGPLYGVGGSHKWAAAAVALHTNDLRIKEGI